MARVFISYAHQEPDRSVAHNLHRQLEEQGHEVFFDRAALRTGDVWHRSIQDGIARARYFVALVSLNYLHREYPVANELVVAAERYAKGELDRILIVNLAYDGEPPAIAREVLSAIQFVKWRSEADTPRIAAELARLLPSPYRLVRGMRWYSASDSDAFPALGRAQAIRDCLALISERTRPFLVIHGVSGAGKSSFVRAGLVPRLDAGTLVIELDGVVGAMDGVLPDSASVVFLDQFEQVLREWPDAKVAGARFTANCDQWLAAGERRMLVFCIRDEYRTPVEAVLPGIAARASWFPLLPFAPPVAAEVLGSLLQNGGIEFDPAFLRSLCSDDLASGVPPSVLPAILQIVAHYFQNNHVPLTRARWEELSQRGASLFERHVADTVLGQLPPRCSPLQGARTLAALAAGEVRSRALTASEIAQSHGISAAAVRDTLSAAVLPRARVVVADSDGGSRGATRYRLVHDLFAPAVQSLSRELALRAQIRKRLSVIAALSALLVAALALGMKLWATNRALERTRDEERATALLAYADGVRGTYPQRSLLLALEAVEMLRDSRPELLSRAGQALFEGLQAVGGTPLTGYRGPLLGLELSPDGAWAFAWTARDAIVWRFVGTRPERFVLPLRNYVRGAAFSPDGGLLVTVSDSVRVWPLAEFPGHPAPIVLGRTIGEADRPSFTTSGRWLVAGGHLLRHEGSRFVDLGTLTAIMSFDLSPDETRLAYADTASVHLVELSDTARAVTARTLWTAPQKTFLATLEFSREGGWLAAEDSNDGLYLWNLSAARVRTPFHLTGGRTWGYGLDFIGFTRDDRWVVLADRYNPRGQAWLWSLAGGVPRAPRVVQAAEVAALRRQEAIRPEEREITPTAALDATGDRLVTVGSGQVYVWRVEDAASGTVPLVLPCNCTGTAVAFIQDRLFLGSSAGPIHEWDLGAQSPGRTYRIWRGQENPTHALRAVPGRGMLLSVSGPDIRMWNVAGGQTGALPLRFSGTEQSRHSAQFSPDGRWLLTSGPVGYANQSDQGVFWSFTPDHAPRPARIVRDYREGTGAVAIGHRWAVTIGARPFVSHDVRDSVLSLWDLADLSAPRARLTHPEGIHSAVLSRGENWLRVELSEEKLPWLWDLRGRTPRSVTSADLGGGVIAAALSDDDRYLCVGAEDGSVRMFSLSGPHPAPVVGGGTIGQPPISTAFLSASPICYTAMKDGTVRFWSADPGVRPPAPVHLRPDDLVKVAGYLGYKGELEEVRITRDGRWLVATDGGLQVFLYDLRSRRRSVIGIPLLGDAPSFSADDRWMASTGSQQTRVWDLSRSTIFPGGIPVLELDASTSVTLFSPDSRYLLTGGGEVLQIRDPAYLQNKTRRLTLLRADGINPLAVSPDGHWLVAESREELTFWPLRLDELRKLARAVVGRELRSDERDYYLRAAADQRDTATTAPPPEMSG